MDDETIREIYHDQEISTDLLKKLNEQRKVGINCDYTLKTEDNGSFTVHKCVIQLVSPFFEKMFSVECNDEDKHSVLLRRCSSDILEKIIEFMYTGRAEVTSDTAREILDTSLDLELNNLVDACTRVLVKTVNYNNCFELLAYSETYPGGKPLAQKCIEVIGKNIETLRDSSEFVEISLDSMKVLCSCDRNLCSEEQLYLAIVKWVKFDLENREQHIAELLDKIKFQNISLEFGVREILTDITLWKNQDYILRITDIISKNWRQQLDKNRNQKIFYCFEPKNLYTVVGNEMLLYDPETKLFSNLITKLSNNREVFGYCTFENKNIFFCGGKINKVKSNDCNYFSFQEKCWKPLPPMEFPRWYNGAITLNKKIYVCGGSGEKTVEIFDINESKWFGGPSFDRDMDNIGLCLYNGNLYGAHRSSLQFLDPRTDKWIALPSLSQNTDGMYSAINYNDYIYGFGLKGIFTFDVRGNKWLENVTVYGESLSNNSPKSCMINNEIYVAARLKDGRFMLNSHNASDLSEKLYRFLELTRKNQLCHALFSL